MQTRIKSAIIYGIAFLLILILAGFWPLSLTLFLGLILVLLAKELSYLMDNDQSLFPSLVGQGLVLLLPCFFEESWSNTVVSFLTFQRCAIFGAESRLRLIVLFFAWQMLALLIIFFQSLFHQGEHALRQASGQFLAGCYLALPLFSANALLFTIPNGWFWLLLAVISPWISDSLAWFVGSKYGKNKIFPILSPNKTKEGFWAGLVGTAFVFALLSLVLIVVKQISMIYLLFYFIFGLVASLLCQLGDLFESALKRRRGVKDSGTLIPGHGGLMDRLDSSLFVLPLFYLVLSIVYA